MVIVTRRFWPLADDTSHRLLQMIDGVKGRGIEVQVVTARWHPSWPERSVLRGARVTRLLPPPRSNWNEGHFQKNVVHWLNQHRESYDSIYVDRADGLLSAVVAKASRWSKPVVARFAIDGDTNGMARGQCITSAAAADACRRCDRVVVPSAASHRMLLAEGIDPHRIERIPDWVSVRADRSVEARAAAGASLFQVSSDFVVPGRTDLIVHYGTADTKELMTAVKAVCDLLDQGASLRMWILGSGGSYADIHETVKDRGWHREILLFDGFDDLEEIGSVADLAIVTNPNVAFQFSALLFLNSEIPMIVAEGQESKVWLSDGQPFKTYSSQDDLRRRLQEWQIHRQQWNNEASILRSHATNVRHSPSRSLDQWESLLRSLRIGISR